MPVLAVVNAAGRRRSPATMPGNHAGRLQRNKGLRYPADPPTVQEIVAVMRRAGSDPHGARVRALIVVLWRGGLRIQEALALGEGDLDPQRGSCTRWPLEPTGTYRVGLCRRRGGHGAVGCWHRTV
jgi:integrase